MNLLISIFTFVDWKRKLTALSDAPSTEGDDPQSSCCKGE